eukprot:jgi/Undpi1/12093/HiC_scaffold_4.g01791.m1
MLTKNLYQQVGLVNGIRGQVVELVFADDAPPPNLPLYVVVKFRGLMLGLTNGIAPALRTTLHETCGPEHVFEGMTYFGGGKAVSLVVGTGIGGLLAQPAINYPELFSATSVFGKFPFLLPNLVGAVAALLLLPAVILLIPETKHLEEQRAGYNASRFAADEEAGEDTHTVKETTGLPNFAGKSSCAYQSLTDNNGGEELCLQKVGLTDLDLQGTKGSIRKNENKNCNGDAVVMSDQTRLGLWGPDGLLAQPNVKIILLLVCVVQALVIGFEEAFPLWALSTPGVGGLGWGTVEIGEVFLTSGAIIAVLQLVIFPRAIKALKITIWQRTGCLLAVPAFVAVPYSKELSYDDSSLFILSVTSTSLVYGFMAMVNLALLIASTSVVPSRLRGRLAGLYNMAESLGRSLGPVGFATVFAWSISDSSYFWVDHRFMFLAAALSMALVAALAWGTITNEHMVNSG